MIKLLTLSVLLLFLIGCKPEVEEVKPIDPKEVFDAIKNVQSLYSYEYKIQKILFYKEDLSFYRSRTMYYPLTFTVIVGVDLQKVNLTTQDDKLVITLPKAEILEHPVLKPTGTVHTRYTPLTPSFKHSDETKQNQIVLNELKTELGSDTFLKEPRISAIEIVNDLMTSAGAKNFIVK